MSEKEGRQASNSAAFPELEVGYETRAECACPDGDEASNNDRPEWSGRIWGMHLQINVRSNLRGGHKEKGGGQDDDDTTQARHCDLEVTNTFGRAMTSEGRSCSVRSSRKKKERETDGDQLGSSCRGGAPVWERLLLARDPLSLGAADKGTPTRGLLVGPEQVDHS